MLDTENYVPRLRADYDGRIKAAMKEEFGYKNDMMIPKLDKICLLYTSPSPRDKRQSRMPSSA